MSDQIRKVVDILTSDCHSLLGLAKMSGRDPFTFYKGADLRGVDLESQDLRGLNFESADLRLANLNNIRFDAGAFNGSVIDETQKWVQDDFFFAPEEIIQFPVSEILLYARIRPGIVDTCLSVISMGYVKFAEYAKVGIGTLRKSRIGRPIAVETGRNVFHSLIELLQERSDEEAKSMLKTLRQPNAQLLEGGNNRPFKSIDRTRLDRLFRLRAFRIMKAKQSEVTYGYANFRDTPEFLSYYEREFEEYESSLGQLF